MSTPGPVVPPGRAGRLWLQRRLETARRGADLLDRKLRLLQAQLDQARESTAQTSTGWQRSQAEAESWLLRAALLGGQRAIRLADDGLFAEVTITYAATMGIRYPADATCVIPPSAAWDGPAVAGARQAHRAALIAAVRHAAAAEAERVIEAETLATRHRLRAIRDRWIPRLEQALADVTFAIEEQERADAVRLRLAASAPSPPSPAGQIRHLPTAADDTGIG
jgi:V/A-type H+/Na+-transporting ATPase subunit D